MIRFALLALSLTLSTSACAADDPLPAAGTAIKPLPVDMVSCRDGTMTRVPLKSGSCSQHGGVGPAVPASSPAPMAAPMAEPAPAPMKNADAPVDAKPMHHHHHHHHHHDHHHAAPANEPMPEPTK